MTNAGWKLAEPAKEHGLLGGLPINDGVTIKAGVEGTFEWEFATNLFIINRDAQLRLLIDTWQDKEKAMRREKPTLEIPTDAFVVPELPRSQ